MSRAVNLIHRRRLRILTRTHAALAPYEPRQLNDAERHEAQYRNEGYQQYENPHIHVSPRPEKLLNAPLTSRQPIMVRRALAHEVHAVESHHEAEGREDGEGNGDEELDLRVAPIVGQSKRLLQEREVEG